MLSEKLPHPAPPPVSLPNDLSSTGPQPRQPRVLISEDDPDLRAVMRAFLRHEGYEVVVCGDGQRALELCRDGSAIDVLISDVNMPQLNGIELATAVSAMRPNLSIILISGTELNDAARTLVASSEWRFFTKPFTLIDMLSAVHSMLGRTGAVSDDRVLR